MGLSKTLFNFAADTVQLFNPQACLYGSPAHNRRFREMSGMSFDRIAHMLQEQFPDIQTMQFSDIERTGFFGVAYTGPGYAHSFILDLVHNNFISRSLKIEGRERGLGRRMFAQQAVMGLWLGMKDMSLTAAYEMGGYVWARTGVHMNEGYGDALTNALRHNLDLIKDRISPDEYASIHGICSLAQADDLHKLAHFDRAIKVTDDIFKKRSMHSFAHLTAYKGRLFHGDNPDMSVISISQFILLGMEYDAHVNLSDNVQMTRLEKETHTPIRAQANQLIEQYAWLDQMRTARNAKRPLHWPVPAFQKGQ